MEKSITSFKEGIMQISWSDEKSKKKAFEELKKYRTAMIADMLSEDMEAFNEIVDELENTKQTEKK